MYAVQYVEEEELPPGQNWVMVRQGLRLCLFLKRSAVTPCVLEEAWAAYRHLERRRISRRAPAAAAL